MSRVPALEASEAARDWFAKHEKMFVAGTKQGLWQADDHPDGMRSHEIPYQPRWGFDEVVLNELSKVNATDPLTVAYDQLTETMMRWLRGEPPMILGPEKKAPLGASDGRDITVLEAEVTEAEQRGDVLGMARSLARLALELCVTNRYDEAIRKAEQAGGIFLSRGATYEYTGALYYLGWALTGSKRFPEAEQALTKALALARTSGNRLGEGVVLQQLAETYFEQGAKVEALRLVSEVNDLVTKRSGRVATSALMARVGILFRELGNTREALVAFRQSADINRANEDGKHERHILQGILALATAGEPLPDALALRARLAELEAATPSPSPE